MNWIFQVEISCISNIYLLIKTEITMKMFSFIFVIFLSNNIINNLSTFFFKFLNQLIKTIIRLNRTLRICKEYSLCIQSKILFNNTIISVLLIFVFFNLLLLCLFLKTFVLFLKFFQLLIINFNLAALFFMIWVSSPVKTTKGIWSWFKNKTPALSRVLNFFHSLPVWS